MERVKGAMTTSCCHNWGNQLVGELPIPIRERLGNPLVGEYSATLDNLGNWDIPHKLELVGNWDIPHKLVPVDNWGIQEPRE